MVAEPIGMVAKPGAWAAVEAQLAGCTSRSLGRMALSLRYSWDYNLNHRVPLSLT